MAIQNQKEKVTKVILILQKYVDVQKNKKKRIIYEDEIDGLPNYEPESPSEEEQENNNKTQIKPKGKQAKVIERPKKVKKGITKSIKI